MTQPIKNSYFTDDVWEGMRDGLAQTILLKQAAKLIDGDQLTDVAREMANVQMAEMGIMPKSCREDAA